MRARGRCRPLLALGSFLFSGSSLSAQAVLTGLVREDSTNRPLAGVQVLIEGSKRQTQTDLGGRYELNAPAGNHVALFRAIGYRPVRMRVDLYKGEKLRADALMVPDRAQPLEPVVVSGQPVLAGGAGLGAFEERRRLGFGRYIDSAELRRSEHLNVQDLLRRVQGINLIRFQECEQVRPRGRQCGPVEIRAASARRVGANGSQCWMQVIVDGAVVFRSPPPGSSSRDRPPDFSRDFTVGDLEAIEIYRSSAETPMEFGEGGVPCGAIVLWSRRSGLVRR